MLFSLLLVVEQVARVSSSEQMFYPWAKTHNRLYHFEERQNEILTSLRDQLHLEVLADKLPVGMSAEKSMYARNSEGQVYTCGVTPEGKGVSQNGVGESSDASLLAFEKAFGVIDRLKKMCIIHAIDWWSYEWCHRKEVKQFHMEVDQKTKKHQRNPEWSLGTYVYSDYYSHEFDEETVEEVIDYYEDGQHCDETGEGRKTEVHLRCCSQDSAVRTYRSANSIPPEKILAFEQLRETKVCSYRIDLCTPLLCEEIQHADRPEKLKALTLLEFMDQFRHACMQRQENWWTYEACFGSNDDHDDHNKKNKNAVKMENHKKSKRKQQQQQEGGSMPESTQGIRQFHVETVMTKTDKENEVLQRQVIQSEFLLGSPPLHMYKNGTALSESVHYPVQAASSVNDVHTSQPKTPSLHLEFSDGAACDIEDVKRGTTVEISCGDRDAIEDIIEDRTCHYVIKISSRLICRVDGFSPPKKEVVDIHCAPVDENSKAEEVDVTEIITNDTEMDEIQEQVVSVT